MELASEDNSPRCPGCGRKSIWYGGRLCGGRVCSNDTRKKYERDYYARHKSDPAFMEKRRQKSRAWYQKRKALYDDVCGAIKGARIDDIEIQVSVKARELAYLKQRIETVPTAIVERTVEQAIYALGLFKSREHSAKYSGISIATLDSVAAALERRAISPSVVVKKTHAKWKAAYDALRELGVEI